MSFRYVLPPTLLVLGSTGLAAFLVHATIEIVAPGNPRSARVVLMVAAAVAAAFVSGMAIRWLIIQPLRRMRHAVYRMSEGDFAVRTEPVGIGLTAAVLRALDDLAGRLEARWEAVRASEARYRSLFDNSPAGIFRTRPDGRVLECNMTAVPMLGYESVAEAKTHNARTFYADPADRASLLETLRLEELVTNRFVVLRRKDGDVLPVLLTVHRTQSPEGPCFEGQFIDARVLEVGVGAHVATAHPPRAAADT